MLVHMIDGTIDMIKILISFGKYRVKKVGGSLITVFYHLIDTVLFQNDRLFHPAAARKGDLDDLVIKIRVFKLITSIIEIHAYNIIKIVFQKRIDRDVVDRTSVKIGGVINPNRSVVHRHRNTCFQVRRDLAMINGRQVFVHNIAVIQIKQRAVEDGRERFGRIVNVLYVLLQQTASENLCNNKHCVVVANGSPHLLGAVEVLGRIGIPVESTDRCTTYILYFVKRYTIVQRPKRADLIGTFRQTAG